MNRILFILGGSGQIGQETCKKLSNEFNLIVVLDLKKPSIENKKVIFEKFDCSNFKVIESNIKNLIKKYGTPHTFINCSYPKENQSSKIAWSIKRCLEKIFTTEC